MRPDQFVVRIDGTDAAGLPTYGTGFLVSERAHVATCLHVVDDVSELRVQLPYSRPWRYRVAARDAANDLAILESEVPPTAPTPTALLTSRATEAVASTDDLHFYGWSAAEHHDAPQRRPCSFSAFAEQYGLVALNGDVNPGDSGAPVLDANEQVLGVMRVRDRDRAGQAMMIPAAALRDLLQTIAASSAAVETSTPERANVLYALLRLSRPQFERALLILGAPQASLPPYDAGQDARARGFLALRSSRELPQAQIEDAILEAQRQASIGTSVREALWKMAARLSRPLYEALAGRGAVTEPLERRALEEYHRDLSRRMSDGNKVQLIEQSVGEVDEPAQADPFADSAPRGIAVRRIRHLLRLMTGLSQGGDQSSAQLASIHRRSKVVRDAVATLMRAERPVILLGEPGSGKSMTLREVARDLILRKTAGPRPPVVVYARLGSFTSATPAGIGDVVEFVRSQIPPRFQAVRDAVPTFIAEGRLIVAFDGMDEMERHRYNERVRALSRFAAEHEDSVRTLFSCRINDFTPEFSHHQLVLLPFGEPQVAEFVRRNVRLPLTVNGVLYRRSPELVRAIRGRPGIAEMVNNPLMLFLTCRYLVAEQHWPGSRASLFRSYVDQHLRKMTDEGRLTLGPDEPQSLLDGWAAMAFELMLQARGDLPISGSRIVEVGRRAGVLQVDTDDENRVRFAHHRFQEYFAARHLATTSPGSVEWSQVLDLPNWQETLLNLASLQPQCEALLQLQQSLARPATALEAELAEEEAARVRYDEAKERQETGEEDPAAPEPEPPKTPPTWRLDADNERLWADRVVLASHVMREAASERAELPVDFPADFHRSLALLAKHGRPTSQVKMIWAWRNAPGERVMEALEVPVTSPIGWVRDQAILLVGAIGTVDVSRNLALDLAVDLAAERVLARLPTYIRAARASGPKWVALVIIAALCQAIFLAIAAAFAGAIALLCDLFAPDVTKFTIRQGLAGTATLLVMLGLAPLIGRKRPVYGGARLLFYSGIFVLLACGFAWLTVVKGLTDGAGILLGALLLGVWVPAAIIEPAFWCCAFVFLLAVRIIIGSPAATAAARLIGHSPAEEATRALFKWLWVVVTLGVFAGVMAGLFYVLELMEPLLATLRGVLPWESIFKWFMSVLFLLGIVINGGKYVLDSQRPLRRRLFSVAAWTVPPVAVVLLFQHFSWQALALTATGLFLFALLGTYVFDEHLTFPRRIGCAGLLISLPIAVVAFFMRIGPVWDRFETEISRLLALHISTLMLAALALAASLLLLRYYIPELRRLLWGARRRVWLRDWNSAMLSRDPYVQNAYLQFDRSSFLPAPLSAAEYLAMLIAVEEAVTHDPAATEYWRQRQQMEQAARQERRDTETSVAE